MMKHPGHPGRHIREELRFLNISVANAAEGLGVTRHQLRTVISGKSRITPDMAVRLAQGIGSTAETWLKMQAAYEVAQARDRAEQITIARLVPKAAEARAPRLL